MEDVEEFLTALEEAAAAGVLVTIWREEKSPRGAILIGLIQMDFAPEFSHGTRAIWCCVRSSSQSMTIPIEYAARIEKILIAGERKESHFNRMARQIRLEIHKVRG